VSTIAALQLPTLPMSDVRLDYYFRGCAKQGVKLVVLGEYVLNSFFKELASMPKGMAKEQSEHKIKILKSLCAQYDLTVIAPLVLVKKEGFVKVTAKFSPRLTHYYPQHWLVHFRHWNEERFFLEPEGKYELPVFVHEGVRFGVVNGFEAYFDAVWAEVDKKRVDAVLMPSVGAFESKMRWRELLRMRALTHNVYILRVNRIGNYKEGTSSWHFYGDSFVVNPHGEMEVFLGDKEEMLLATIDKTLLAEARRVWGWRNQWVKKGVLK